MIGRDLGAIRKACGVTTLQLAAASGLRPTTIHGAEASENEVSVLFADCYIAALARLAERSGQTVDEQTWQPKGGM